MWPLRCGRDIVGEDGRHTPSKLTRTQDSEWRGLKSYQVKRIHSRVESELTRTGLSDKEIEDKVTSLVKAES